MVTSNRSIEDVIDTVRQYVDGETLDLILQEFESVKGNRNFSTIVRLLKFANTHSIVELKRIVRS
jgi:hypothetical protein